MAERELEMSSETEKEALKVQKAAEVVSAVGTAGTVAAVGGGTSAAAITTGLSTIGSVVGGGMLAGVAICAAAPVAIGGAVYGLWKWLRD